MIRRIPVHNAVTNKQEVLEGEVVDELKEPSVFVDRSGKTYDASKGVALGELPNTSLVQLPRTSWYVLTPHPINEDLVIVGYLNGPEGCVPIFERRSDGQNRGVRTDALRSADADKPRRNWRARKAARNGGALALPDSSSGSGGGAEP
jgi:hypothetical protein